MPAEVIRHGLPGVRGTHCLVSQSGTFFTTSRCRIRKSPHGPSPQPPWPHSHDSKLQRGKQYSSHLQAYTFRVFAFGSLTQTLHGCGSGSATASPATAANRTKASAEP